MRALTSTGDGADVLCFVCEVEDVKIRMLREVRPELSTNRLLDAFDEMPPQD